MLAIKPMRILLMPDVISGEDSGARSVRSTVGTLIELGHTVAVYSRDGNGYMRDTIFENVEYFKCTSRLNFISHFYNPFLMAEFRSVLDRFRPNYVFFLGSIQKPAILSKEARRRGIQTIFLFYINDFYCAKIYAGLTEGPCFRCIDKNALHALRNGCIRTKPVIFEFIKKWAVRSRLRAELLKSYQVVGYSDDQLSIYRRYGLHQDQCSKIGFQFDQRELQAICPEDRGYFLLMGQPTIEKGWHVLKEVFSNIQSAISVKVLFRDQSTASDMLQRFDLTRFVASGMIEVVCTVTVRTDLLRIVSLARGVIIPTYYPTTGEFALLESLLLGKPVIVFNVGAHRELISHKVNGMIANVGDLISYSKSIDEINLDSDVRHTVSKGARLLGESLFTESERLAPLRSLFK